MTKNTTTKKDEKVVKKDEPKPEKTESKIDKPETITQFLDRVADGGYAGTLRMNKRKYNQMTKQSEEQGIYKLFQKLAFVVERLRKDRKVELASYSRELADAAALYLMEAEDANVRQQRANVVVAKDGTTRNIHFVRAHITTIEGKMVEVKPSLTL